MTLSSEQGFVGTSTCQIADAARRSGARNARKPSLAARVN